MEIKLVEPEIVEGILNAHNRFEEALAEAKKFSRYKHKLAPAHTIMLSRCTKELDNNVEKARAAWNVMNYLIDVGRGAVE